jgi:hypothetical protein
MKTKIKVKEIEDKQINVCVNSPSHRIEEIKQELQDCFETDELSYSKAEVIEMWEEQK